MQKFKQIASILLAFSCILATVIHLSESIRAWNPDYAEKEMATSWENRMQAVRENLPGDVIKVGYLDESFIPGIAFASKDLGEELALTQFSLAPVIVSYPKPETAWIVGNFGSTREDIVRSFLDGYLGEYTMQRYMSGIYLIHVQK